MKDFADLKTQLGAMGRSVVPLDEPRLAGQRRDLVLDRIVRVIAIKANERRRTERRKRLAGKVLVAAFVPGLFVAAYGAKVILSGESHTVSAAAVGTRGLLEVKTQSVTRSFSPGHAESIATGDEVATERGGTARLTLPGGTALAVASATRLHLTNLELGSQVIDVKRGFVTVTVPKLTADGSFTVTTPDARIVVHGTVFTVEVESPARLVHWTTVTVSEGVVSVFHAGSEVQLHPGERWSSRGSHATPPASPEPPPAPSPASVTPSPRAASTQHVAPAAPSDDHLLAQNEIFTKALRARRAGDDQRTLRSLRELLARYPHAALEHEARVEELRALERLKDPSAVIAARRYLSRYPDGFAADEARAIIDRK